MKKVTAYKVDTLANLKPNAIVALKTAGASTFSLYVTDLQGVPYSLNLPATTGVQQIINTDGALQVVGSTNVVINLEPAILASINSALQVGDNISSLLNDAGYLTSFTESDPIFLASEASNFVVGDKANLDNQSGINTNDETTTTIQTKRPLKTVTNKSLEGLGNIGIDYNDLDNKPTTFPPSSHTHIEADITDLDKYTKVETDNLLGNKLDKVTTSGVERAYIINADGSQGTKPTSEIGIKTSEWFDWSNNSVITGWSSFALKKINCKLIDDCLFVNYNIIGTSNSTAIKFTLPFVNKEPTSKFDLTGINVNNNTALTTPGRVQILVEVNEIEILRDLSGASYTAAGGKHVSGGFFMSVYKTSVFNKGIGGNNTSDVIARLVDINSLKANLAIVMIGTNDWRIPISGSRRTPTQYKTNLTTIVNSLQANGSQVLLLQFPPIVGAESDYVCPFFGQPSGCDSNATAIPFREKIFEVVSEKSTMY